MKTTVGIMFSVGLVLAETYRKPAVPHKALVVFVQLIVVWGLAFLHIVTLILVEALETRVMARGRYKDIGPGSRYRYTVYQVGVALSYLKLHYRPARTGFCNGYPGLKCGTRVKLE